MVYHVQAQKRRPKRHNELNEQGGLLPSPFWLCLLSFSNNFRDHMIKKLGGYTNAKVCSAARGGGYLSHQGEVLISTTCRHWGDKRKAVFLNLTFPVP